MKTKNFAVGVISALVGGLLVWLPSPAQATGSGIDYYISAPFVQNSHIDLTSPTTYFEDFETFSLAGTTSAASGTITWSSTASTQVFNADQFGGATSTSSSPVVGGAGSKYLRPTHGITISFATPQRYLGFWWSAGSGGNTVKFRSGGTDVLTLTTADLFSLFGTAPASGAPINNSDVLSFTQGGTTINHPKDSYFGNPRGYSTTTPTNNLTTAQGLAFNEPFTYLHVFANGTFSFDEVILTGGGFELDNFVVSSVAQTPDLLLHYKVASVYPSVTFDRNLGFGSMTSQMSSNSASLSQISFTRTGYQFLGWNTLADGSGTTYSNRATFDFQSSTTLFAQWRASSVKFDANGGSGNMADQASAVPASLSANTFTRAGFTFAGWNTDAAGAAASYADQSTFGFTSSPTLFAQWSSNQTPSSGPARYDGPVAELRELLPKSSNSVRILVKGNKLELITGIAILGRELSITSQSRNELTFEFLPSLEGTYSVDFFSQFGKLTVMDAITVIASPVAAPSTDSAATQPPTQPKEFEATKRFFRFIGDRSVLVSSDRSAIQNWIRSFDGIQEVTCLGSTSGIPMISTDPSLARKRAVNACKAIARSLPGVRVSIQIENGKGIGQFFRAVQVTLRGEAPQSD